MKLKRGRIKFIASLFYCLIVGITSFFLLPKISYASEDHLLINEIYPAPVSSCDKMIDPNCDSEWIELYNPTNQAVDLKDLFIMDDESLLVPVPLDKFVSMPVNSYLVLTKGKDFSFILSNTEESILLKKKVVGLEDRAIDMVSYGDTTAHPQNAKAPSIGKSITRKLNAPDTDNDSVDFVIATPTPGAEFKGTEINNEPINISDARDESNGTAVTISGAVTVLPGVLSSQYFYIQDQTGGIQIYSYYKNFPILNIGDIIQVSGELSEVSNERRLKINAESDITVISHETPLVPKPVEIVNIGEGLEGQYVKISGSIAETSGDTFIVQDKENHQVKVVIKSMTNIDKPKMHKGDEVEISGIVSQYKDEYRILPTVQNDVKILSDPVADLLPVGGPESYLPILLAGVTIAIANSIKKLLYRFRLSRFRPE